MQEDDKPLGRRQLLLRRLVREMFVAVVLEELPAFRHAPIEQCAGLLQLRLQLRNVSDQRRAGGAARRARGGGAARAAPASQMCAPRAGR